MKTSELTGRALDYAVALAEGYQPINHAILATTWVERKNARGVMDPCPVSSLHFTDGIAGDDIIDREGISIIRCDDDYGTDEEGFCNNERIPVWCATLGQFGEERSTEHQQHDPMYQIYVSDVIYGTTRREAAMRAYVASKLGDEVEIPKELQDG